jgi:hypothetical protein
LLLLWFHKVVFGMSCCASYQGVVKCLPGIQPYFDQVHNVIDLAHEAYLGPLQLRKLMEIRVEIQKHCPHRGSEHPM